jgi:hypothetical protein
VTKSQPSESANAFESRRHSARQLEPVLRFSPSAWAKLMFFRDREDCEIGGFGVCDSDDLLLVTDFVTVQQDVSSVSVAFDDESVADFFDSQIDLSRRPEQFGRIWVHTHPGDCPQPSGTDEECFQRVFGGCDWAVMFILARGGKIFARLQHNTGPGGRINIPVEVDYSAEFAGSDHEAWRVEYERDVQVTGVPFYFGRDSWPGDTNDLCFGDQWLEDLEQMEPDERQAVLAELHDRPDLWDREGAYV